MKKLIIALAISLPAFAFAAGTGSATTATGSNPRSDVPDTSNSVAPGSLTSPLLQSQSVKVQVADLSCAGCENRVKNAVRKIEGVRSVAADAKTGQVSFTYDKASQVDESAVVRAIESEGFTVTR